MSIPNEREITLKEIEEMLKHAIFKPGYSQNLMGRVLRTVSLTELRALRRMVYELTHVPPPRNSRREVS